MLEIFMGRLVFLNYIIALLKISNDLHKTVCSCQKVFHRKLNFQILLHASPFVVTQARNCNLVRMKTLLTQLNKNSHQTISTAIF